MPRLLLLRHASAGPKPAGGMDFDRPLDEAGRREAALMGGEMAARGWLPDRALCSPAARTRQTLQLVLQAVSREPATEFLPDLYDGMEEDYVDLARLHGGEAGALILVGHSPAVRLTALALVAPGDPLRAIVHDTFPTAALAVVEFDGAWADLRPGHGSLAGFLRPTDLGS
ncbi:MAG TPA: histidine phosphatase family protein [Afifellaceae bacterium]|nr:histidine phosphatase family protein [Afifellaceae bacterium]